MKYYKAELNRKTGKIIPADKAVILPDLPNDLARIGIDSMLRWGREILLGANVCEMAYGNLKIVLGYDGDQINNYIKCQETFEKL